MNPYLQVLLATLLWGTSGVYVKLIGLPVLTLAAIRMLAPTTILLAYFIYTRQWVVFRKPSKWLVLASLISTIRVITYFMGFTHTDVGKAIVLLYTWPLFVSIGAVFLLKEKVTLNMIMLIALAFLGTLIIEMGGSFSNSATHWMGDLAIIASSLCSALTVLIFKAKSKGISHTQKVFYQNTTGALLSLLFIPSLFADQSLIRIGISIGYAGIIGVAGFWLFFSALDKIPSSHASSLAYFEVVSTIIFGSLILSEPITWTMLVGGSMIFIAVVFLHRSRPEELE